MSEAAIASAQIPLSLYVHWPWCVRKCPYCDFNSHALLTRSAEEGESAYLDALIAELVRRAPLAQSRPIETLFIGGGTPSLMSAESVERLLEAVSRTLGFAPNAEITLEANPGTVEASRFAAYRAAGVNRISLGIQSLSDEQLRVLGRIHTAQEARAAIDVAMRHFDRVNLDLMFGLPNETLAELSDTLTAVTAFGVAHLSLYQLTIEEGTAFAKRLPAGLPDVDTLADMTDLVQARLAEAGYQHYEVSGYARRGMLCRHNLNYWTYGDYLAIGAGAHAKLSNAQGVLRIRNIAAPKRYLEAVQRSGSGAEEEHWVGETERPFEFMLNALRLVDGVEAALFESRTGLALSTISPVLERLRAEGLLVNDPSRIATTERGLRFLSDVQEAFL